MGFLKRIFGGRPNFDDRVWMRASLKIDDLLKRVVEEARTDSEVSLVVYHFPDTGDELKSRFDDAGVELEELRSPGTHELEHSPRVALLNSAEIPGEVQRGRARRSAHARATPCHVHLAEHYPIPSRDDHVINLHSVLAPDSKFYGYVGLDEAWVEQTVGGTTRDLLEQLGVSDDEPLNHSMIGSALRRAQEQLDKKRRGIEAQARSSREWMELNIQ